MDEEADKNICRISCYSNYFIKKLLVKYGVPIRVEDGLAFLGGSGFGFLR